MIRNTRFDSCLNKTNKHTTPVSQLNFTPGSYLESTSRPLYALVFLLPLIGIYELGTILVNTDQFALTQSRVATFTWLMGAAERLGMHRTLAWVFPGLVVVVILFCWHMVSHHPWSIKPRWIGGMGLESFLLTLPLFALGSIMNSSQHFSVVLPLAAGDPNGAKAGLDVYLANLTTSIGAGIYEELVFRLILIGLIIMVFQDLMKAKETAAVLVAVAVSALLFAGHHYIGFENGHFYQLQERFSVGSFIFRSMAGVYFAMLLRYRGFGVIAGTHAAYDVLMFSFKQFWG
jgi:hypothetical protein